MIQAQPPVSNHSESPATSFLLKEYEQLITEIRNIHDKKIALFRLFITYVIALLAYIVSGVAIYVQSKAAPVYPIPPTVAYGYSILGIMLTWSVYSLVHNAFFYIGPSKKHTVRLWRAVHNIRLGFKVLYPNIAKYLLMPDGKEIDPMRPRLSGRWELGALIYPMYHITFFLLLVLLLTPFFAPIDEDLGISISPSDTHSFIAPFVFLYPLLIVRLVIGNKAMRDFAANIQDARLISAENPYPRFRDRHPQKTPLIITVLNALNIGFSLFLWISFFFPQLMSLARFIEKDYLICCVFSLILQIVFLMAYLLHSRAISVKIKFGGGSMIKFEVDKTGQI